MQHNASKFVHHIPDPPPPLVVATGLLLSRAAVGLGEGVAPSAAIDVVARTVDTKERSRATSLIFSGLHVGSLLGLLAAPPMIEQFGWRSVFYLFGGVGACLVAVPVDVCPLNMSHVEQFCWRSVFYLFGGVSYETIEC